MTKRIFYSISIVALSMLLATSTLFFCVLYDYFSDSQMEQLKMQTDMAVQGIAIAGDDYLNDLDADEYRITHIAADGTVLFDSHSDAASMENHLDREEIREALEYGEGESVRYSDTLLHSSLYYATTLQDGSVVRLSIARNTVFVLLLGMGQPICAILIIAFVLSIVLAIRLSKSIVNPLNTLDLDNPLENDGYDELSPLLRRIDSQQKQLKRQKAKLQKKKDELDTVIGSMNEGIVLLNSQGNIISINPTAQRLLGADESSIGEDIVTVCRNLALQQVVSSALMGERSETTVDLLDGRYQLDASPVLTGDKVSGVALLIFDITEKEKTEIMRREFTANVSHELKTPLHSISGYAELMAGGIVKGEDVISCSKKIYTEAKRMVRLIEDIINLSHLDEGALGDPREDCDLYSLAADTVESLSSAARSADVTLSLQGGSVKVNGIPQLLSGIIFNLCDNAIKYNRAGGSVTVTVSEEDSAAVICVADTGIGIPPEHQSRIFERFYRIDKSHSKEVGGTGLGLSIVKHAARVHNAKIELESTYNVGTTITVRIPK